MYQIKIMDGAGKLKKIISPKKATELYLKSEFSSPPAKKKPAPKMHIKCPVCGNQVMVRYNKETCKKPNCENKWRVIRADRLRKAGIR